MIPLLWLLHTIGILKKTKRAGWVRQKISGPESVADHSFRTAFLALVIAKEPLNRERCIALALIHDAAEALVGDITPHDGVSAAQKRKLEGKAIKKLFKGFPQLQLLWKEFEEAKTAEAQLVHQLDKLEMILQAHEYETASNRTKMNEFWNYVEGAFNDPLVKRIYDALRLSRLRK